MVLVVVAVPLRFQRQRRGMFIDRQSKRVASSVGATSSCVVSMPLLRSLVSLALRNYKHAAPLALGTQRHGSGDSFSPSIFNSFRGRGRERSENGQYPHPVVIALMSHKVCDFISSQIPES